MTKHFAIRREFLSYAALVLLAAAAGTPPGQRIVAGGLVSFIGTNKAVLHFTYQFLDHRHCFSPEWLDPTCPQCL